MLLFLAGFLLLPAFAACGQHATTNCIPQRNFSYVDAQGAAHVTRVVLVPSTVSPEAQKRIGSAFANVPCDANYHHHEHQNPAKALAAGRGQPRSNRRRSGSYRRAEATGPEKVWRSSYQHPRRRICRGLGLAHRLPNMWARPTSRSGRFSHLFRPAWVSSHAIPQQHP